ncbi:MAG: ATP-binding protein, partial [Kiritimatiellae bacterium]|nr:ATP-binding protein [Kiritimatiellia bacterium]
IDFKIFEYDYDGRSVVLFRVNAVCNTPVKFSGEAYIRIGEHKRSLKECPGKERKIWTKTPPHPFGEGISAAHQHGDDVLNKIDYPAFFDLLKIPLPDNRAGILRKLEEEKVISSDESASFSISNLGAILFTKDLGLFPALERKVIRVVVYQDESRLHAEREQAVSKGYAVGFKDIIDRIYDLTPGREVIDAALRVDQNMYPKVAIREFIANALIHQDFSISGMGPMIEIFPTRMEITNPGTPLVNTERFIDHAPRSRNESIAALMRRMNMCEERGSGVDRALYSIEMAQLPAPEFHGEPGYTRVTLFTHREFKAMTRADRVRACYQHASLRWVCRDFMSNATLRERFDIKDGNYPMVSKVIKDALVAGVIKPADPENKSTKKKYIPWWG